MQKQSVESSVVQSTTVTKPQEAPVQKKYTRPTGKLNTANSGIKSILHPVVEESGEETSIGQPKVKENFSFEDLERTWKEYAYAVKREERDLFYSILINSKLHLSSDYKITVEIVNTVQSTELEREKSELVAFLRSRLKNDFITFDMKMTKSEKVAVLDSKSTFDKLAEENQALNKFRKLFNLDIEY